MVVSVGDKVIISKRNKERTVFCEYRLLAVTMNNGLMKVIQIGQGFRQEQTSRSGLEFRFFDITKSIVFSFFLSFFLGKSGILKRIILDTLIEFEWAVATLSYLLL